MHDLDKPAIRVGVEEDPPVANATPEGGRLVLEGSYVPAERIGRHPLEGCEEAFPFMLWSAPNAL